MMELVTIAQYSFAHEARIAKSTLEAADIPAYIRDENLVQANWMFSNALGGVKLQVAKDDVEAAMEILAADYSDVLEAEFPAEDDNEDTLSVCPKCGSARVEPFSKGKKGAFLSWLVVGVPVIPFSNGYRCLDCDYYWKGNE